jgi:hypothetical protein
MKILLLTVFLSATNLYALDAEAIQKLASQAHSRENLIPELKLYPHAREYTATVKTGPSVDELKESPEVKVTEKTVEGRYIVSRLHFPWTEEPLIMVVTYEKKTDSFKKWVILPDGKLGESTGVADFETRTIAWTSSKAAGDPPSSVVSIETHADDKSSWKETVLQDGKVINIIQGVAVKTK